MVARALSVAALVASAAATLPAKVEVLQSCSGSVSDWKIEAPKHVDPNPPRANITVSSAGAALNATGLTFKAHGSLGLPNHPFGLFGFSGAGDACGTQTVYVKDGVLGKVVLHFPPCPRSAATGFSFIAEVNVWTVLPAFPPLVSTGYTAEIELSSGGAPALCLKVGLSQPPYTGASKRQDKCQTAETDIPPYPPGPEQQVPSVTVDLDTDPEHRWDAIVAPRAEAMRRLLNTFIDNISPKINNTVVRLLLAAAAGKGLDRMPSDFASEMRGIARTTGINVGYIWMMNMMYELTGFCTSIVAQTEAGEIYHGRNLDFGIFMGTNATTHNWQLTQDLRDILINVAFTRGGKTVYNATTYAGFVGLLSGGKAGGFSVTVDTRYDASLDKGIIGWLLGKNDDCQFLTFETRLAMESSDDYTAALKAFTTYKPLGPAYIIIGGAKPAEGAIVALKFGQTAPVDVWPLSEALGNGSFYVLETNYDRLKAPPVFDDRRYPAENCLDAMGQKGLSMRSLWGVMSSNPTRNALTTFTTLMSSTTGHFEAYKQECAPGPRCVPF